jgi:3-deoxy-D-manno-octulosonate 8-phosphate phosphatase (KDO 8-P phosphatase)
MVNGFPSPEIRRRALAVRLVLTDVDGVLTDGGVYYGASGEELKRFSVRDGMGVERLRAAGIETGFVTRELSPSVKARAEKLELKHLHLGVVDKRRAVPHIVEAAGFDPRQVAYMGDDVNDLETLRWVAESGLTACPADAIHEVRRLVHFVASCPGGHGAFREFSEWLLSLKSSEVRA